MKLMEEMVTTPRTLADDLLTVAAGKDNVTKLIEATEATHNYLENWVLKWLRTEASCSRPRKQEPPR